MAEYKAELQCKACYRIGKRFVLTEKVKLSSTIKNGFDGSARLSGPVMTMAQDHHSEVNSFETANPDDPQHNDWIFKIAKRVIISDLHIPRFAIERTVRITDKEIGDALRQESVQTFLTRGYY